MAAVMGAREMGSVSLQAACSKSPKENLSAWEIEVSFFFCLSEASNLGKSFTFLDLQCLVCAMKIVVTPLLGVLRTELICEGQVRCIVHCLGLIECTVAGAGEY